MHEQLRHDPALAAAHAAVDFCPGCLVADHTQDSFTDFVQLFQATLEAYDYFRDEECRPPAHAGNIPPEFDGYCEPM